MINKIFRYYNTLKYLKAKQILWRLINLMPRLSTLSNQYPISITSFPSHFPLNTNTFTRDCDEFTFLNETYRLSSIGWDNSNISKLWRYNLHYFNFLLQEENFNSKTLKLNLIHDWIDSNPFGKGTAWEPYPTSVRIINWVKWDINTRQLSEKAKHSLWNQIRWLSSKYEFHILGNHLFINVKAILFASCYFQLDKNHKYYSKSCAILCSELQEQFLPDGSHFELSPMYHSLAMEDLLDLISLSSKLPSSFPTAMLLKKYKKGMEWLRAMSYNNSELSNFNDCANGISLTFESLVKYSKKLRLNESFTEKNIFNYFKESGFVVCFHNNFHLIADVGNIGPDYLPGHAHADTLSFELAANNQRIFVNSGTSVYGISDERLWQRSTLAHNTIQVQNSNSSEVWSGFRVARRAKPFNVKIDELNSIKCIAKFGASHNGYLRLKNPAIHSRSWNLNSDYLVVEDIISGNCNLSVARFYLHPNIKIRKLNSEYILFHNNLDLVILKFESNDAIEILNTTYHDEFGISKPNLCFQIKKVSPCRFSLTVKFL